MNGVSHFDNGRRASFVLLVCANVLMMATASAPSPIYPLYRERWGFSVTMLTVIFAVYVAGLLGALLTVGSLSDHLGRRPVLVAALLVAAALSHTPGEPVDWRRCARESAFPGKPGRSSLPRSPPSSQGGP